MTQEDTNWKNVNNWHWVEKNCLPWAKTYITGRLTGVKASKGNVNVSVEEVREVTGDVDVNQRKGKVITIFDVAITLGWVGDFDGLSAAGKIVLPEFMHDTDLDDLVFDISMDNDTREKEPIKDAVRKELTNEIRAKLSSFSKDLLEAHVKDVYISADEMKGHPVLKTYQPKPVAPTETKSTSTTKVVGGLTTITQTIEFVASARDVFETLLDKQRVQAWSRGNAEIGREVGSTFRLFDGNVSGSLEEVVVGKKIVWKWRQKQWPAEHHSIVTLDLTEGRDNTVLKLTQKDVPIGEKDSTEKNWTNYYWNSIKATFGYVSSPISRNRSISHGTAQSDLCFRRCVGTEVCCESEKHIVYPNVSIHRA
ncbi:activator of Hsp90 ATPase [Fimicolochytrium jonesii]|uniref:activator of Hsp90 ATPase n=1 Tax=Fimicolochytrium jonesii TaxID=1396493 RepID=UPI0022FEA879|nr:activator of Hsp90 ATPase [Fimicolochytrium jonesii]KAI8825876.1 activator of Hsp90 ATPase [Fimicolochytrium jonesii]